MFDIKPKLLYESLPVFKLCNLYSLRADDN